MNREIENITILFHDTYEELAKEYGYKTREDTKVFDMESPNGKTMLKTVEKIITPYLEEVERLNNIINEIEKELIDYFKKEYPDRKLEDYNLENCTYDYALVILGRLQELKGDGSNEKN